MEENILAIEQLRKECLEAVSHPGKFQCEPIYSPYFYDATVNGDGVWEDETHFVIDITEDDRKIFPEIPSTVKQALIFESENGFVFCNLR